MTSSFGFVYLVGFGTGFALAVGLISLLLTTRGCV